MPAGDPLSGAVVAGKYRVVELVARGGMGRIYRAEQLPLGREVALKILTRPVLGSALDETALEKRFLLEAATCARLAHPNTVSVYDYGSIDVGGDPTFYIVMELVRGRTLAQVLRSEGPFTPPRAARVVYEITRSLREAHAAGVVHRDLKPSNVMLMQTDEGESVKVLDFGVAKVLAQEAESLTTDGSFVGSPRYTAPEQIRQQPVDGRSDLYALGIVLWELLTGAAPFSSNEPMRTLLMHLNDPLPPFLPRHQVPAGLEAVVRRLLEKDPAARYPDADALLAALRPFRAVDGPDSTLDVVLPMETVTQPTGMGTLPPGAIRSGGLLVAAVGVAGAVVVFLALAAVGVWWLTQDAAAPPPDDPGAVLAGGAEAGGAGGADVAGPVGGGVDAGGGSGGAATPLVAAPIEVRLTSDPEGAEVRIDGKAVGVTPYTLAFPLGETSAAVELVRAGYKRRTVTVEAADPDGAVAVSLERAEGKRPPAQPPPGDGLRMER